jgi:hypothetical protein
MKPNTVVLGFYDSLAPEDLLRNRIFPRRRKLLNYGLNATHSTSFQTVLNNYGFEGTRIIKVIIPLESLKNSSFFVELRKEDEPKSLTLDGYVEIVRNTLKLKKNLCIARKFNTLNKQELLNRGRATFYIDVWPVGSLVDQFADLRLTSHLILDFSDQLPLAGVLHALRLDVHADAPTGLHPEHGERVATCSGPRVSLHRQLG